MHLYMTWSTRMLPSAWQGFVVQAVSALSRLLLHCCFEVWLSAPSRINLRNAFLVRCSAAVSCVDMLARTSREVYGRMPEAGWVDGLVWQDWPGGGSKFWGCAGL